MSIKYNYVFLLVVHAFVHIDTCIIGNNNNNGDLICENLALHIFGSSLFVSLCSKYQTLHSLVLHYFNFQGLIVREVIYYLSIFIWN